MKYALVLFILAVVVLAMLILPMFVQADNSQWVNHPPLYTWVIGKAFTDAHQHGCCTWHARIYDWATKYIYTCSVPYEVYWMARQGTLGVYSCYGKRGSW